MNPNDLHKGNLYYYVVHHSNITKQRVYYPVIFLGKEYYEHSSNRERYRFFDLRELDKELYFTLGGAYSVLWDMVENEGDEPI